MYGTCLFYLQPRTGNWASKLKGWMDTAMHPTPIESHYRIAPAVLIACLDEANETKWVAHEALGRLRGGTFIASGSGARPTRLLVALAKDGRDATTVVKCNSTAQVPMRCRTAQ